MPAADCVCCYEAIFQWWQIVQRLDQKANRVGRFHIRVKDSIDPARAASDVVLATPAVTRSGSKHRLKRDWKNNLPAMGVMIGLSCGIPLYENTIKRAANCHLLFWPPCGHNAEPI